MIQMKLFYACEERKIWYDFDMKIDVKVICKTVLEFDETLHEHRS